MSTKSKKIEKSISENKVETKAKLKETKLKEPKEEPKEELKEELKEEPKEEPKEDKKKKKEDKKKKKEEPKEEEPKEEEPKEEEPKEDKKKKKEDKKKKKEETKEEETKEEEPKEEEPKEEEKKKKKEQEPKKDKKKKKVVPELVVPELVVPELVVPEQDLQESFKEKGELNRESILEEFDNVISIIDLEIEQNRKSPKCEGIKFLRNILKNIKSLRANSSRLMKKKTKSDRKINCNSGFLKPVGISAEMAKFTGWNPEDLHSRVEVTKYICDYIKENNLQNPADRREIQPDSKLQKLLDFKNKEDNALKYYSLQTHLKKHFVKT